MPCDGRNENCKRRRELLTQLKSIVDALDRKKPCEWDKSSPSPPIVICKDVSADRKLFQHNIPLTKTKSVLLRGSILYKCECIRRNGLQDRCMMMDCMGKPECTSKLYPMCEPGRKALTKFMKRDGVDAALERLIAADKARESALENYCKLFGSKVNNNDIERLPPSQHTPSSPFLKNHGIQSNHQKMINTYQYQQFQQPHPTMPKAQSLYQEPIYQQPMNYLHVKEPQYQRLHQFHPQNSGYPTSFMNNQPTHPPHQGRLINQRYQFQMPTQFVQLPPSYSHPPPNPPYVQNNYLPC